MIPTRGAHRYIYRSWVRRLGTGLFDALGYAGVALLRSHRFFTSTLGPLQPQRILAIRLDHIGDVLFVRPALQALRALYPQARITVLVSSAAAALLKNEPGIDEVIGWDAPWFDRSPSHRTQSNFWSLARQLRQQHFDLGLEFRGDLRQIVLLTMARVAVRVGYGITGGGFLLNRCLRLRTQVHEVERNLDVIRALGGKDFPSQYPHLTVTPEALQAGQTLWGKVGKKIVIHPGAGDPAKCWPVEKFAEVCRVLAAKHQIILVGTRAERSLAEQIVQASGHPLRNCAGETSLPVLAGLLASADLFIGNDSGPAHMALTQGVATVLLWSETNTPEEWGPWGTASAHVIRAPQRREAVTEVFNAVRNLCPGCLS